MPHNDSELMLWVDDAARAVARIAGLLVRWEPKLAPKDRDPSGADEDPEATGAGDADLDRGAGGSKTAAACSLAIMHLLALGSSHPASRFLMDGTATESERASHCSPTGN